MRAISRRSLLRTGVVTGAAAGGGALLRPGVPEASRGSAALDAKILAFVLGIERLQQAFYTDALAHARLTGELHEFATTALGHEREHVGLLTHALGSAAPPARRFAFGDATRSPKAFAAAARELEDVAVQAYNAGAPSLRPATLAQAGRIVSVEARHVSWIRDITGFTPAPTATDAVVRPSDVQHRLDRLGFTR